MAHFPLVHSGPEMNAAELARTARQRRLPELGETGQRRLANARVLVLGAGGLGSPALLYLAAAGVGTLGIVDDDIVELSNLQRQIVHGQSDLGRPKTASAAETLAELNPTAQVTLHTLRLSESNAEEVFSDYDLVIDGSDNFDTRYLSNDVCAKIGLPLVWASVLRFDAQISVFWARPPHGSGIAGIELRDLYPQPPAEGEVPNCAEAGVLGALCGQVGSIMATEAIKLITGIGEPLIGRVLVIDALRSRFTEVPLRSSVKSSAISPPSGNAASAPQWPTITVEALQNRIRRREQGLDTVLVVDVREPSEYAESHIPDALLLPLDQALSSMGRAVLPRDRPLVVHCHRGGRALRAVAALREAGFTDVTQLDGGIVAWNRAIAASETAKRAP